VASTYGIGMDGLLSFYDGFESVNDNALSEAFIKHTGWHSAMPYPYAVPATPELLQRFEGKTAQGITATAPGFYGSQGRKIRLAPAIADINEKLASFSHQGQRIVNLEMETSALYGMAAMLGHNHLTICTVIANRPAKQFTPDLDKGVENLITTALELL
jgi:uridine phosphorylase